MEQMRRAYHLVWIALTWFALSIEIGLLMLTTTAAIPLLAMLIVFAIYGFATLA